MSRVRIEVGDLKLGMYVAELDRPWLESPFLFQGFMLEEEEDLQTLRSICQHVMVDAELSRVQPDEGKKQSSSPPHANLLRGNGPPPIIPLEPKKVVNAVRSGHLQREQTHNYLKQLFRDLRLGHTVDTEEAQEFVEGLVDTITDYPDVAIWLTQMKNRDEYTSLHCLNVCVLTVAFCRHLGYAKTDLETIGMGALLHDIGKSRTPEAILNKPGPLTPEEWKIMCRHPEDGYQIMKDSKGIPEVALQIIRGHHRRLNGHGYPDSFPQSELDVPVLATSIADVYDAMTSDRPYHRGLGADVVLKEMHKLAPETFGKELMEHFIRCVGIFPVGSVVELGSGSIALVISPGRTERLLPQVLLLRNSQGKPLERRKLVDLAVAARKGNPKEWQIHRVVEPSRYQISQRELTLAELVER